MFRTAEGAGVTKMYLCGYTPTPIDRFGRIQTEIKKTSLGASTIVPWEHTSDPTAIITQLQKQNVIVIAVEQSEQSISAKHVLCPESVAYVMGNEIEGVSDEVLRAADQIMHVPMLGKKESLNVATTAGIVLYRDII